MPFTNVYTKKKPPGVSLTFMLGSSPCVPRNSGALDDGSAGGFQGVHPEVCPLYRQVDFPSTPKEEEEEEKKRKPPGPQGR